MAPPPPYSSALLFCLLLLLVAASPSDSATNSQELEDVLQSLRNYGYSLFANGVATSDLKYELLNATAAGANFTLFAARDELLYALDMAAEASIYVSTLRYHVASNRHTFAELKNLSAPFLETLLPDYAVLIGKVRDLDASSERPSIGLIVDGVRIAYPDLFLGSRMAVHGIDGILLTGLDMSRDLRDDDFRSPPPPPPAAASAPSPLDADIPPAAPPSNDADKPPSPPASSFVGIIPSKGISKPNSPTPPDGDLQTPNSPTPPESDFTKNILETPNSTTPPAEGTEMPNSPTTEIPNSRTPRGPENDRNNARGAKAAPRFDWTGIPTISQDQMEKMKRLGMKMPGKALPKGRRRYRRRRALSDL